MGVASNIIGQPLKLKHFFGLLHASVWLILPFLETDEDLVDTALLYSLFYYLQDTVWSIGLGQYSMAAHHIVLCTFWFFLVWKRLKFKEELLLSCMFFAEIGAFLIHLKYLFQDYSVIHNACFITYVLTRLIAFPLYVLPKVIAVADKMSWSWPYVCGVAVVVATVAFSTWIIFSNKLLFLDAIRCRARKLKSKVE
jgi:hypothetical protein